MHVVKAFLVSIQVILCSEPIRAGASFHVTFERLVMSELVLTTSY